MRARATSCFDDGRNGGHGGPPHCLSNFNQYELFLQHKNSVSKKSEVKNARVFGLNRHPEAQPKDLA
jgi:hypothetical protein